MSHRRRPRTSRVAAVVAMMIAAASLPSTDAGAGPNPKNAPRFADGVWGGEIVYSVNVTLPGSIAAQAIIDSGTFELQVTGGSVSGTLHAIGEGTAIAGADAGTGTITFDGTFSGDSAHPVFSQDHFGMSGNAVIGGIAVPLELDFGGNGRSVELEIGSASCDAVGGSFEQQAAAAIGAAGGTPTSLTAFWFAVRQSESIAPATEPLKELMSSANELLQAFQLNGTLDPAALFELVKSAESFDASLQKNTACGIVDDPTTFSLAITDIVKQMLTLAFGPSYAVKFTTAQLADLVYAGFATGAIGPGAIDQAASKEILAAAKPIFADRLDQAIKGGFKSWMEDVLEISIAVPWPDLAADAQTALAKFK